MPLADLKKFAGILSKGALIQFAPGIAQGFLVELLKARKIDVQGVTSWVQKDTTLWDILEPKEQASLKNLANRVGSLNWLDFNWTVNAIRADFPAVASLFLGWVKAKNWLTRQLQIIKKEVEK